ncbi:MAG: hypothetical protein KDK70_11600 [Myxococcales bacterium]|nr:hypothetical protein [Myxococcales bacterium]
MAHAAPSSEPDVAAAAKAYGQAQEAELRGDFARAGELYELADALAPSPQALRAAVRTWRAAEEDARAANLSRRLADTYDDDKSQRLAQETLDLLEPQLGLLDATCDSPCSLSTSTTALASDPAQSHRVYLAPGRYEVIATFGELGRTQQSVLLSPGEQTPARFELPPRSATTGSGDDQAPSESSPAATDQAPSSKPKRARLSPVYFAVGAVVTVGLGATTAWSGADVLQQNSVYEREPTQERLDRGRNAELRTNVLIGTTAAFGIATVVLAIFTDWKKGRARGDRRAWLRPSPSVRSGGTLVVEGRF